MIPRYHMSSQERVIRQRYNEACIIAQMQRHEALQAARNERDEAIRVLREEQRARKLARPESRLAEYMALLMRICLPLGLRCDMALAQQFATWKNQSEFAPNTNLYQKARQFIDTQVSMSKPIPVFAKTMVGDLIPLEYRPERDAQDMLLQLEKMDSELYPLGSVSLTRSEENQGQPVQPEELFFLFHLPATDVTYSRDREQCDALGDDTGAVDVRLIYPFSLINTTNPTRRKLINVEIEYFPITQTISTRYWTHWDQARFVPVAQIREYIAAHESPFGREWIPLQTRNELCDLFDVIRRDRF